MFRLGRLTAAAWGAALWILATVDAHAGDLLNVTAVSTGDFHVCALLASGGVKCWGANEAGELGAGSFSTLRDAPADVAGLTSGVTAVTAGGHHTCALMAGGGVKCWGWNGSGQLGDGTTVNRNAPVDVLGPGAGVVAVSAGDTHTCALTATGGVKCWGENIYGLLADGATTQRLVPTDVPSMTSGIAAVSAGSGRTCVVTEGGAAKCWGLVAGGPHGGSNVPVAIPGLSSGVVKIAAGGGHVSCAVTNAPAVKCWGSNFYGDVGDGTMQDRSSPVDVVGSADMSAVAPGSFHNCALTTAGAVKCWGDNYWGQLGQGYVGWRLLTPGPAIGVAEGVVAISSGGTFSCAVMTSGRVKCWGDNIYHQLSRLVTLGIGVPSTIGVPGFSSQTVTFASIPNHDLADAPFGVTASSSRGLPVTLESLTPAVCSASGSTVTLVSIGICAIAARQPGDATTSADEVMQTFRVSGSTPTMPPRLANISTRAHVGTGTGVLIAGFVVTGFEPKLVAITATGPSLSASGISNPLANPTLSLVRVPDGQPIDVDDDWVTSNRAAALQAMGLAPSDPREPAILARLAPGAYTAIVSGANGATGVSVVAVYEIDRPETPLVNISTRGNTSTGENVMIAGFVVNGATPKQVAIVGTGPSLSAFGVQNALADPTLELVRMSDGAVVATNDDWGTAANASDLQAAGFAPTDAREAAILTTLPAGAYTAILRGAAGGTGIGVVAVYAVP